MPEPVVFRDVHGIDPVAEEFLRREADCSTSGWRCSARTAAMWCRPHSGTRATPFLLWNACSGAAADRETARAEYLSAVTPSPSTDTRTTRHSPRREPAK
jgi:hypothetical protein